MTVIRGIKNVVNNYTEAEIKVREATSNDPWGPSATIMGEISDLSHNQIAFTEVMAMLWKRLNDHGKNWRHVYKSLLVLEYLIKHGSERVTHQCKENLFAIDTLKNFQFADPKTLKDEGHRVRERAGKLVDLLKDEDILKVEREKARTARSRMQQQMPISSLEYDGSSRSTMRSGNHLSSSGTSRSRPHRSGTSGSAEMEAARPSTMNEEDLQLQLALEMSKAEAEKSKTEVDKEDLRLKMAIKESLREEGSPEQSPRREQSSSNSNKQTTQQSSGLLDLGDPWSTQAAATNSTSTQPPQATDPFASAPTAADPWGLGMPPTQSTNNTTANTGQNPWATTTVEPSQTIQQAPPQATGFAADPWGEQQQQPAEAPAPANNVQASSFDPWGNSNSNTTANITPTPAVNATVDPFNMGSITQATPTSEPKKEEANLAKNFLGEMGANLVNLESLTFTQATTNTTTTNTTQSQLQSIPFHNNNNKPSASPNVFDMSGLNSTNPFASSVVQSTGNVFSASGPANNNPFAAPPAHMGPTLNQLRAENKPVPGNSSPFGNDFLQPTPVGTQSHAAPAATGNSINPFM